MTAGGYIDRDALPVLEHPAPYIVTGPRVMVSVGGLRIDVAPLREPIIRAAEAFEAMASWLELLTEKLARGRWRTDVPPTRFRDWLSSPEPRIVRARRLRVERAMRARARRAARHGRVLR